jgi:hypothetical protein
LGREGRGTWSLHLRPVPGSYQTGRKVVVSYRPLLLEHCVAGRPKTHPNLHKYHCPHERDHTIMRPRERVYNGEESKDGHNGHKAGDEDVLSTPPLLDRREEKDLENADRKAVSREDAADPAWFKTEATIVDRHGVEDMGDRAYGDVNVDKGEHLESKINTLRREYYSEWLRTAWFPAPMSTRRMKSL